uniref:SEC16 homolog B, endoplasmic reticulum export factor n=1 Tax=Falco tinnunculus TaxID=100819 RepID=A0A8C4VAC1_FALTI
MNPWPPAWPPQPRGRQAAWGAWGEAHQGPRWQLLRTGPPHRPGSWDGGQLPGHPWDEGHPPWRDTHRPASQAEHGDSSCPRRPYSRQGYGDSHRQYPAASYGDDYTYQSHQRQPVAWQDDRDLRQGEPYSKSTSYQDQHYYRGYHPNLATTPPGQDRMQTYESYEESSVSAVRKEREGGEALNSSLGEAGGQPQEQPSGQPSLLLQYRESGLSSSGYELSQYIRDGADHYDPVLSGTWSLAQAGGPLVSSPAPVAPRKFSLPHTAVCFGAGGQLVLVCPQHPAEGRLARVELHSLEVMLHDTEELEELRAFPGPLAREDLHKVDVITFCQQKIATSCDLSTQRGRDSSLLWKLLVLLCRQNGDALVWAMRNQLWGHALFLSSKMDPRTYSWVLTGFTSTLATNDPLQTLFQLMSGRIPQAALCCGDATWGDWRPHLAVMLSNKVGDTELSHRAIVTLGDTLAGRGAVEAANFCYLMADIPFGYFGAKADRMALLGSSHRQVFTQFARTEAIQRTEILEYCQRLQQPKSFLLPFQVYKLLYASRLADYGLPAQALQYCEQIATALLGQGLASHPLLAQKVMQLAERLKLSDPLLLEMPEQDQPLEPDWLVELRARCREQEVEDDLPPEVAPTQPELSWTAASMADGKPGPKLSQSKGYQYDYQPVAPQGPSSHEDVSHWLPAPAQVAASPLLSAGQELQPPMLSPGAGGVSEDPSPQAVLPAGEPGEPWGAPLSPKEVQPSPPAEQEGLTARTRTVSESSTVSLEDDSQPSSESTAEDTAEELAPAEAAKLDEDKSSGFRWFGWFRSKPTRETSSKATCETAPDSPPPGPQDQMSPSPSDAPLTAGTSPSAQSPSRTPGKRRAGPLALLTFSLLEAAHLNFNLLGYFFLVACPRRNAQCYSGVRWDERFMGDGWWGVSGRAGEERGVFVHDGGASMAPLWGWHCSGGWMLCFSPFTSSRLAAMSLPHRSGPSRSSTLPRSLSSPLPLDPTNPGCFHAVTPTPCELGGVGWVLEKSAVLTGFKPKWCL